MKIGMIIISNRPKNLERFLNSYKHLGICRNNLEVYAIIQPPFTGNEPFLQQLHGYRLVEAVSPPTPFVHFRKEAMRLAQHCDWFWSLDDDHVIQNSKGDVLDKTAEEYYDGVFQYLYTDTGRLGALSCKGFLGGYAWGYDIVKNPDNGLVATDKGGIFLRNIGIDKIIEPEEEKLVGALFESLAIYNIMSYGYDLARRFNSPLYSRPPGKDKHIGGSLNPSYSDTIVGDNIQKRIREKFHDPFWTHGSKRYPFEIAKRIGKC